MVISSIINQDFGGITGGILQLFSIGVQVSFWNLLSGHRQCLSGRNVYYLSNLFFNFFFLIV